jgi:uridylate kinase
MPIYSRVMLKLSGEAFGGEVGNGLDPKAIHNIADEVREVAAAGVELAIVIGGGNFIRGAQTASLGIERGTADYMGMLATLVNGLALQAAVEAMGYPTRVLSAIDARQVVEPYIRRRALRHMEKGRVVILAGGTGNPYFTTDTAAALRATELGCNVFLKATKVDGIYTADPMKDKSAKRYDKITYSRALAENLKVLDATAFTLCRENKLPIIVYSIHQTGNTLKIVKGQPLGTVVEGE